MRKSINPAESLCLVTVTGGFAGVAPGLSTTAGVVTESVKCAVYGSCSIAAACWGLGVVPGCVGDRVDGNVEGGKGAEMGQKVSKPFAVVQGSWWDFRWDWRFRAVRSIARMYAIIKQHH